MDTKIYNLLFISLTFRTYNNVTHYTEHIINIYSLISGDVLCI